MSIIQRIHHSFNRVSTFGSMNFADESFGSSSSSSLSDGYHASLLDQKQRSLSPTVGLNYFVSSSCCLTANSVAIPRHNEVISNTHIHIASSYPQERVQLTQHQGVLGQINPNSDRQNSHRRCCNNISSSVWSTPTTTDCEEDGRHNWIKTCSPLSYAGSGGLSAECFNRTTTNTTYSSPSASSSSASTSPSSSSSSSSDSVSSSSSISYLPHHSRIDSTTAQHNTPVQIASTNRKKPRTRQPVSYSSNKAADTIGRNSYPLSLAQIATHAYCVRNIFNRDLINDSTLFKDNLDVIHDSYHAHKLKSNQTTRTLRRSCVTKLDDLLHVLSTQHYKINTQPYNICNNKNKKKPIYQRRSPSNPFVKAPFTLPKRTYENNSNTLASVLDFFPVTMLPRQYRRVEQQMRCLDIIESEQALEQRTVQDNKLPGGLLKTISITPVNVPNTLNFYVATTISNDCLIESLNRSSRSRRNSGQVPIATRKELSTFRRSPRRNLLNWKKSSDLTAAITLSKRPQLILTWTRLESVANYVEITGTFLEWGRRLPLWYCETNGLHWIDLQESVPDVQGIIQFKFIVDGEWMCHPEYPICDDGSLQHNLNNVCVICPQRVRMRLSSQRLRRCQSSLKAISDLSKSTYIEWDLPTIGLSFLRRDTGNLTGTDDSNSQTGLLTPPNNRDRPPPDISIHDPTVTLTYEGGDPIDPYKRDLNSMQTIDVQPDQRGESDYNLPPIQAALTIPTEVSGEELQFLEDFPGAVDYSLQRRPTWASTTSSMSRGVSSGRANLRNRWRMTSFNSPRFHGDRLEVVSPLINSSEEHCFSGMDIGDNTHSQQPKCDIYNADERGQYNSTAPQEELITSEELSKNLSDYEINHRLLRLSSAYEEASVTRFSDPEPKGWIAAEGGCSIIFDSRVISGGHGRALGSELRATFRRRRFRQTDERKRLESDTVGHRTNLSAARRHKLEQVLIEQHKRENLIEEDVGEVKQEDTSSDERIDGEAPPLAYELDANSSAPLALFDANESNRGTSGHRSDPEVGWPNRVTDWLYPPEVLMQLNLPSNNIVRKTFKDLRLVSGWAMAPKPDKLDNGGADGFYVSTDMACMALADGVGEWDSWGFSPQSFADELMIGIQNVWENPSHPIHQLRGRVPPSTIARELMTIASRNPRSYGSATCCIVVFCEDRQQVGVCNLGDSGVCMLRRNSADQMASFFQTKDMCHFFNCPYQLSNLPPISLLSKMLSEASSENGRGLALPCMDEPKDSHCFDVNVMEGDLILIATDGMWDNLWPSEITSVAELSLTPLDALLLHDETFETAAHDISRAITEAALIRSQDYKSKTPFAESYTLECGMPAYRGGKWDDITVLSAWVCRKHRTADGIESSSNCNPPPVTSNTLAPLNLHATRWPYRSRSESDLTGAMRGNMHDDTKRFIERYMSGVNKSGNNVRGQQKM